MIARVVTALAFLLLYIPLVTLVWGSFHGPEGWTLEWYARVLTNSQTLEALERSVWIAACSTLISTVLGTAGALALERSRFRAKSALEVVTFVPLVMPEIVLGLSLLIWFVALRMTLGVLSIMLAHVTFSVSYVIITVRARLEGLDPHIEEAAQDLGATPLQVFFRVTLPLILPGVVSGALMAFTLSFDDFLITFFTAGVGTDTLPLRIYSMIKYGISPEIHALSTVLMVATFLLVFVFYRPRRDSTIHPSADSQMAGEVAHDGTSK